MIVERFFKKDYIDEHNDICDKILNFIIEFWLNDIKHNISYEYYEKVNNAVININLYEPISNFNATKLKTKNNIKIFNNLINFFEDKTEFVIRSYTNNSIQVKIICWDNIQDILKELEMMKASKKYNL